MTYLFCNNGYGQAFMEVAVMYAHRHKVPMAIVYSSRRGRSANRLRQILSPIKSFFLDAIASAKLTRNLRIPVILVPDVNSWWFRRRIMSEDSGIVCGFNQIFRARTIDSFGTLVNFHPSVLPFYRGPVPSYWAIQNREEQSGYTLHRIRTRIDDGEILYQQQVAVDDIKDPQALDRKIAGEAVNTLRRYLDHLKTGSAWAKVQIDAPGFYKVPVGYLSFPGPDGSAHTACKL